MRLLISDRINLEQFRRKSKPVYLYDTKHIGFGIKINPKGQHKFIIQFRDCNKQTKRVTIASVSDINVKTARELAREIAMEPTLNKYMYKGIPKYVPMNKSQKIMVLAELLALYTDDNNNKQTTIDDRQQKITEFFGDRMEDDISSFSSDEIREWYLSPEQKSRPRFTDLAYSYMKAIFNYAVKLSYIKENPFDIIEVLGLRYKSKPRVRMLYSVMDKVGDSELKKFWKCLNELYYKPRANKTTLDMIKFFILTGIRSNEIYKMQWFQDAEDDTMLIEIPDTKNSTSFYIPVTDEVKKLDYLVANENLTKDIRKTLHSVCSVIGKTDAVSPHDLRRTSATLLGNLDFSVEEIDRFLNHSTKGSVTETHYVQRRKDTNRKAIEAIENYLNGNEEKIVMSQSRLVKRKRVGK